MIYRWPTSILKDLPLAIWNFIWTGFINHSKSIIVAWNLCCRPFRLGGLGMKNLKFA